MLLYMPCYRNKNGQGRSPSRPGSGDNLGNLLEVNKRAETGIYRGMKWKELRDMALGVREVPKGLSNIPLSSIYRLELKLILGGDRAKL